MKKRIGLLMFSILCLVSSILIYHKYFLKQDIDVTNLNKNLTKVMSTTASNTNESNQSAEVANQADKTQVSQENIKTQDNMTPKYVKGILIVNKKYPLPKSFAPGENPEARANINQLINDAQKKGLNISNQVSGFRSYEYQNTLYHNYVNSYGKEQADKFSARAGHSEHQTGLAFDLIDNQGKLLGASESNQDSKTAAKWVADNAHHYGFIVRYKEKFKSITGYQEETWHLRYVGNTVAKEIYDKNISLEEYLGVLGGDY